MSQADFYRLVHVCPCGSGLASDLCRDKDGNESRACERCKPRLLFKIFESRYMDLFRNWIKNMFNEENPDWEWAWEDMLKERGCEQVAGLEMAKRRRKPGQILIPCPNGPNVYVIDGDASVHILVPGDYVEKALSAGKMI